MQNAKCKIEIFKLCKLFCILHFAFYILISVPLGAEIRTRLSPSPQRTLESAGAVLLYSTPATVNGNRATLGAYTFPAAPSSAGAEAARLLNLPHAPSADGLVTSDGRTHLIVLPGANPFQSLLMVAQYDAAPNKNAGVEFPENLPRPDNAAPTFSATLDATQTSFAAAVSTASPEALHDDMRRRLLAQKWQAALPATSAQSMAVYSRGNAVFLVFTAPQADGSTRLSLLQRLTSDK